MDNKTYDWAFKNLKKLSTPRLLNVYKEYKKWLRFCEQKEDFAKNKKLAKEQCQQIKNVLDKRENVEK